MINWWFFFSR